MVYRYYTSNSGNSSLCRHQVSQKIDADTVSIFNGQFLLLIRQNNLTDSLNWIEQHYGWQGEAALLALAIAQKISAALPSLPSEKGGEP